MSNSNTLLATRLQRRVAVIALWAFAVVAIVACDGKGSGLIGRGGTATATASLRSLTVSAGTLTPAFDSATTAYSNSVTFGTPSITVAATPTASSSVVTVNGTVVPSGGTSPSIPLTAGTTTQIFVRVVAPDTITARTYTISVVRPIS
jgi:hypothetical protein